MKDRIIEIVELGEPKSLIQRENTPITELIETDILIDELNELLRLYNVVGRRELFVCGHPPNQTYLNEGTWHCEKCGGKWESIANKCPVTR